MGKSVCYKYIIRDSQQMCFADYELTDKYYSSKKACERDWGAENTECCFSVIAPFLKSKQTGRIAEVLTKHEIKGEK